MAAVGAAVGAGAGAVVGFGDVVGSRVVAHVSPMEPGLDSNILSVETPDRSQQRVWLKDEAPLNIAYMLSTRLTSQEETSLLKDDAP